LLKGSDILLFDAAAHEVGVQFFSFRAYFLALGLADAPTSVVGEILLERRAPLPLHTFGPPCSLSLDGGNFGVGHCYYGDGLDLLQLAVIGCNQ